MTDERQNYLAKRDPVHSWQVLPVLPQVPISKMRFSTRRRSSKIMIYKEFLPRKQISHSPQKHLISNAYEQEKSEKAGFLYPLVGSPAFRT
ncbi:hypothetical protein [Stappia sp. ES.058]|uniref:hypothetical protein n=1 Tax=Stappia sp. ES.058 TaxID=1881061 RepID=UPI0012FD684B|nr:hypothetical protein [Stappia sp. ES.058]